LFDFVHVFSADLDHLRAAFDVLAFIEIESQARCVS
jgi:hypothetical protein